MTPNQNCSERVDLKGAEDIVFDMGAERVEREDAKVTQPGHYRLVKLVTCNWLRKLANMRL